MSRETATMLTLDRFLQLRARLFNTVFNPTNARQGTKVLRERLRGPSIAAYYPRRMGTIRDIRKLFPGFETFDEYEEDRLEGIQIAKSRGKGAPKKKRTAAGKETRAIGLVEIESIMIGLTILAEGGQQKKKKK
jgi:small subunit ribosomal protein S33